MRNWLTNLTTVIVFAMIVVSIVLLSACSDENEVEMSSYGFPTYYFENSYIHLLFE